LGFSGALLYVPVSPHISLFNGSALGGWGVGAPEQVCTCTSSQHKSSFPADGSERVPPQATAVSLLRTTAMAKRLTKVRATQRFARARVQVPDMWLRCVWQELAKLQKDAPEWCEVSLIDDDLTHWTATLTGPVTFRTAQCLVGRVTT
jgi:hypothetical protein